MKRKHKQISFLALSLLEQINFENFALYQFILKGEKDYFTKKTISLFSPTFFEINT